MGTPLAPNRNAGAKPPPTTAITITAIPTNAPMVTNAKSIKMKFFGNVKE